MLMFRLPGGQRRQLEEGSCLLPLAEELAGRYNSPVVEGVFNGEAVDLQRPLHRDGDVDFVDMDSEEGMRIYVRTLLFIFLTAAKKLRSDAAIEVRNTLGSALYCEDRSCVRLTPEDIKAIENEMRAIVGRREPITLHRMPKQEAMCETGPSCSPDRMALLKQLPEDAVVSMYELEGSYGYFFGSMCPDTGYVPYFELLPYDNGVIINYPALGSWNELKPFVDQPRLNKAFEEAEEWASMIRCNTVGKLNKYIEDGYADKIIQIAEALHEKKLVNIADYITERRDRLKLILIAGPSSSGKTSTAQRLSIQLSVNGIKPMPVSMDDYYKNRTETPRKPDGSYDFESIEAVDLQLFSSDMNRLMNGEKIEVPKFNFRTGTREYRGRTMQMTERSVLIVEGIHGLNPRLTEAIDPERVMKLYVSALTPMSMDEHNRINTTDVRLMRRIVRDSKYRSHTAAMTLNLWDSVRQGEEQYIFPYQCSADIIFNTTLIYELAVLKKYVQPLLEAVTRADGLAYMQARRLLGLLAHVREVDDSVIPNNSILKEFIGGSVFKEAL